MSLIPAGNGADRTEVDEHERGQTMAEYAVVLAVISAGIILALAVMSESIRSSLLETVGHLG